MLVADGSYGDLYDLYDLYAIGVCLVIQLQLFFLRFDASKHRAELQPKCIESTAPSRV